MPWSPREIRSHLRLLLHYFSKWSVCFWKEIFCCSDHLRYGFNGLFVPNEHLSSQPQLDTHTRLPHFWNWSARDLILSNSPFPFIVSLSSFPKQRFKPQLFQIPDFKYNFFLLLKISFPFWYLKKLKFIEWSIFLNKIILIFLVFPHLFLVGGPCVGGIFHFGC